MDVTKYIECQCETPEHLARWKLLEWDGDDIPDKYDLYFSYYLFSFQPWWKRLFIAVKYVLKIHPNENHFSEQLMRPEQAKELRDFLDEYIKFDEEYRKEYEERMGK